MPFVSRRETRKAHELDHTAVLVAIKGYEPYFDVERGTFHVVDDEGTNNWVANPNGRDLRLIEKMPLRRSLP